MDEQVQVPALVDAEVANALRMRPLVTADARRSRAPGLRCAVMVVPG